MQEKMDYLNSIYKYVNDLSVKEFERMAKFYQYYYNGLLPENKNARILDLGCGTGHFLYFLDKKGYKNYYGVDLSEEEINFCKENVTKNVEAMDGFDFLKKNRKFDLIVLNDVLEHIKKESLFEFLKLIHNSLEKGGRLLIKVPNMANPFALQSRYADITHDIGFTELSLREALITAGFKNIIIRGSSYPIYSYKTFITKIIARGVKAIIKFLLKVQGYYNAGPLEKHLISSASVD